MPEDKYTYKSTLVQRDFGQQVLHIANANALYLRLLSGKGDRSDSQPAGDGKSGDHPGNGDDRQH